MKTSTSCRRRGLIAGLSLLLFAFASSAFAAREAANEVGHWLGFAHSTASDNTDPGTVLDLAPNPNFGRYGLQGTISLPAVQMPLAVTGVVSRDGRLLLALNDPTNGILIGLCDGSVRPVDNFGQGSGQDDLGSLNFLVLDANGRLVAGHMNLLHMFGGQNWQMAGMDWSQAGGLPQPEEAGGAFIPGGADMAGNCSFFATQGGGTLSSALTGGLSLLPAVQLPAVQFQMVGTANGRGSIIMMCDGSVRNGDQNALIGLLFTGALAGKTPGPPQNHMVGHFGAAGFGELLPAVQKVREAAMSFSWAAR